MPANSLRFRTVKWYVVIRGNNLSTIFWHLFKNRLSCEYQSLKAQNSPGVFLSVFILLEQYC